MDRAQILKLFLPQDKAVTSKLDHDLTYPLNGAWCLAGRLFIDLLQTWALAVYQLGLSHSNGQPHARVCLVTGLTLLS